MTCLARHLRVSSGPCFRWRGGVCFYWGYVQQSSGRQYADDRGIKKLHRGHYRGCSVPCHRLRRHLAECGPRYGKPPDGVYRALGGLSVFRWSCNRDPDSRL
jgi:hypothetical protein